MSAPAILSVDVRDGAFTVSGPPEAALEVARRAVCLRDGVPSQGEQQLRLECLKLACDAPIADEIGTLTRSDADVLATAARYYQFVRSGADA